MNITYLIRNKIIDLSGYWIFKKNHLPPGIDLHVDIVDKLKLKPKVIFDIGANIGQTTDYLLTKRHFNKARIFAFEPVSNTYNILKQKFINRENVVCENMAMGSREEERIIKIYNSEYSYLNSLKNSVSMPDASDEKIKITTVDEYLRKKKIKTIDILKIDTEGFEIEVLEGARETLANNSVKLIYAEVAFDKSNTLLTYLPDIYKYLTERNFMFFSIYDVCQFKFNRFSYGNALFIHDSMIARK